MIVLTTFIFGLFFVGFIGVKKAEAQPYSPEYLQNQAALKELKEAMAKNKQDEAKVKELLAKCEAAEKAHKAAFCIPVPLVGFKCEEKDKLRATMENACTEYADFLASVNNSTAVTRELWKKHQEEVKKELRWQKFKDNLAGSIKLVLSAIFKQIAYDTATWIGSGGKGQQPLFITEGVGRYLENTGDAALGMFIDNLSKRYGVSICEPEFGLKILIPGYLGARPRMNVRCKFTKIMENWEEASKAIADGTFFTEYNSYYRPGGNNISSLIVLKTNLIDEMNAQDAAEKLKILSNDQWKSLEDYAGWVLTPGTMVRNTWETSQEDATAVEKIYTGTFWDFIATFADTLAAQVLKTLYKGFFSAIGDLNNQESGGGNQLQQGLDVVNGVYDVMGAIGGILANPEAQPRTGGIEGMQVNMKGIITSEPAVGNTYDILGKLMQCTDDAKVNPGPTDCVTDQLFVSAIRDKKLVKDLPESVRKRQFAPKTKEVSNPQTVFTLRNVIILRKYRIVPVGWEIAARYVAEHDDRSYTLQEVMDGFYDPVSPFFGLIDPKWVLKAPELFCRREGYGAKNEAAEEQDNSVRRETYCADEQQCIKEDDNGNCKAFGYCTEETRTWNFSGTKCQPLFNTCQAFTSRRGVSNSYLTNTLDYSNCDAQVAGCRWYSAWLNPLNNYWEHLTWDNNDNRQPVKTLARCGNSGGCAVSGVVVPQWKSVAINTVSDATTILNNPCPTNGGCDLSRKSCTIARGGVICHPQLDDCAAGDNALSGDNADFGSCGGWNADQWVEGWAGSENKHYCVPGGRTNNAFQSFTSSQKIVSTLPGIKAEESARYTLHFWAKKTVRLSESGSITINISYIDPSGEEKTRDLTLSVAADITLDWREYIIDQIDNGLSQDMQIQIVTNANTNATVDFDDFSLVSQKKDCTDTSIALSLAPVNAASRPTMYFDRDAQVCDATAAGCSQFIRIKGGLGSNLIANSGFEEGDNDSITSWEGLITTTESKTDRTALRKHSGEYSLSATKPNDDGYWAYRNKDNIPAILMAGRKYAVSAWVLIDNNSEGAGQVEIDLYSYSANAGQGDRIMGSGQGLTADQTKVGQWQKLSKVLLADKDYTAADRVRLRLVLNNDFIGRVYFDDVQLEELPYNNENISNYRDYNPSQRPASQLAYLKKAPDYYACYLTDNKWPTTRDELQDVLAGRYSDCQNFAGVCIPEEVGCDSYKPTSGDPAVPGRITQADICPQECLGYQVYRQEATNFTQSKYTQFIADNKAKYCPAAAAGCDEFTNLDKAARGGEAREYYSRLRVCQKPAADDATYYTWEGSDTTGYQLKTFKLKNSQPASADVGGPCTKLKYNNHAANCDDLISAPLTTGSPLFALLGTINLPGGSTTAYANNLNDFLADLNSNQTVVGFYGLADAPSLLAILSELHKSGLCAKPEVRGYATTTPLGLIFIPANTDCREFYDTAGGTHYRLLSKVVYSSDDCHPYRRSQTQTAVAETQEDCLTSGGDWNGDSSECVYMAIPGQGAVCAKNYAGCREYKGNNGNNIRQVFVDDFEKGKGAWTNAVLSLEANYPGGQSLSNAVGAGVASGKLSRSVKIRSGRAYMLSFWAKCSNDFSLGSIKFSGAGEPRQFFSVALAEAVNLPIANEWQKYNLGPVIVDWNRGEFDEQLEFNIVNQTGNKILYLDNVVLTEVWQNVFAIENSWFTPQSCDNKLDDPQGAKGYSGNVACPASSDGAVSRRCYTGEMLGCAAYVDRANQQWNLRSFESLCRPDAVGCEALIETFNSDTASSTTQSGVTTPADRAIYMVNDQKFSCAAGDKGCSAYGAPRVTKFDETIGYDTVYLKNQPDRYNLDLCQAGNLWCEEFATAAGGAAYFKDPRDKVCQYQTGSTGGAGAWRQKDTEADCAVSAYQTIGRGTVTEKLQPVGWYDNQERKADSRYTGWAGVCPTSEVGCTEYLDPLTNFYTNLLDFKKWVYGATYNHNNIAWAENPAVAHPKYIYRTEVNSHVLYALSFNLTNRQNAAVTFKFNITCSAPGGSGVNLWSPDASVIAIGNSASAERTIEAGALGPRQVSARFYVDYNDSDKVGCEITVSANSNNSDLSFYANYNKDSTNIDIAKAQLTRAGVYYYLASTVKEGSGDCNGAVDYFGGCVLFNNRGQINFQEPFERRRFAEYLYYDADATYQAQNIEANVGRPVSPSMVNSDSNSGQQNSGSIIKVSPDRQCASWLTCISYEKDDSATNEIIYGNKDRCFELGLCNNINDQGECTDLVLDSEQFKDAPYSPAMANRSGFAMASAALTNWNTGAASTIKGLYPYDLMKEEGESSEVPNGNFESVYNNSRPVGWLVVDEKNPDWQSYKFEVGGDSRYAKQDASYLMLKGAYKARSEEIDLSPNASAGQTNSAFILAGWINTQDLGINSAGESAQSEVLSGLAAAKILFRITNASDESVNNGLLSLNVGCSSSGIISQNNEGWIECDDLEFAAGKPWQRAYKKLIIPAGGLRMRIMLVNDYPDFGCQDNNSDTACPLSGQSLFDDVSLKPVLRVGSDATVSRSCRLYPAQDALSCKYFSSGQLYFGQYGYCLVEDPENPGICLQWWPVDQIKGETLDELSGYEDRAPLYYCLKGELKSDFGVFYPNNIDINSVGDSFTTGKSVEVDITNGGTKVVLGFCHVWYEGGGHASAYTMSYKELGGGWKSIGFGDIYNWISQILEIVGPILQNFLGIDIEGILSVIGQRHWYAYCVTTGGGSDGLFSEVFGINGNSLISQLGEVVFNFLIQALAINYQYGDIRVESAAAPIEKVKLTCARGDGDRDDCEYQSPIGGVPLVFAWGLSRVWGECTDITQTVNSVGYNKAYATRVKPGSSYQLARVCNQSANGLADTNTGVSGYAYGTAWAPYGSIVGQAGSPLEWYSIDPNNEKQPYLFTKFDFINRDYDANQGIPFEIDTTLWSPLGVSSNLINEISGLRKYIGQCSISKDICFDQQFFSSLNVPGCPLPHEKCLTLDRNWKQVGGYTGIGSFQKVRNEPGSLYCNPVPNCTGTGGQCTSLDAVREVFAKNYGYWRWDTNSDRYLEKVGDDFNIKIPEVGCGNSSDGTGCYVAPRVISVRVNKDTDVTLSGNFDETITGHGQFQIFDSLKTLSLDFNVLVRADQLPLRAYRVDWGDGSVSNVSGVNLRNRFDYENPISLYHTYDYWRLKNYWSGQETKNLADLEAECPQYQDYCFVHATIQLMDNWDKTSAVKLVKFRIRRK